MECWSGGRPGPPSRFSRVPANSGCAENSQRTRSHEHSVADGMPEYRAISTIALRAAPLGNWSHPMGRYRIA
jgi:hypothetical protein